MALGYKSLIKIRCVSHFHVPQSCMSWAQNVDSYITACDVSRVVTQPPSRVTTIHPWQRRGARLLALLSTSRWIDRTRENEGGSRLSYNITYSSVGQASSTWTCGARG